MGKLNDGGTITVVVTTYNHQGKYLPKSLASVFDQTRKPAEVIIVDDGSTDNTPQIVAKFGQKVRYIRHKKRLRGAPTFNSGLGAALSDYLIILPAEFYISPFKRI